MALQILREVSLFAWRQGLVNRDPVAKSGFNPKRPMKIKKQIGRDIPRKEDLLQLIKNAPLGWPRDIITVAALTGMRSGELRALQWEDVDFEKRVITVCRAADDLSVLHPPKTQAGQRQITMSPTVFDTLWHRAYPPATIRGSNVVELTHSNPRRTYLGPQTVGQLAVATQPQSLQRLQLPLGLPTGYVFLIDVVQRVNRKWEKPATAERIGRHSIGKMFRGLQHQIGMVTPNPDFPRTHQDGIRLTKDWDEVSRRIFPIVEEIKASGITSLRGIARELTARGIPRIRGDGPWNPTSVRYLTLRPMRPRYDFHTLRHFAASWFIEQGHEPKHIQAIMGHSSITMTFDLYGHLFPGREDDYQRLAAADEALFATSRDKT